MARTSFGSFAKESEETGPKNIVMWSERYSWKKVGRKRDCSTFASQMQANFKQDGGRHKKAQALPVPRMARGQTGDPRGFQKSGSKDEHVEERVEVAKRYRRAPIPAEADGTGPLQHDRGGSPCVCVSWWVQRVGPETRKFPGGEKFSLFFPLPPQFFPLLGVFSRNFGGV